MKEQMNETEIKTEEFKLFLKDFMEARNQFLTEIKNAMPSLKDTHDAEIKSKAIKHFMEVVSKDSRSLKAIAGNGIVRLVKESKLPDILSLLLDVTSSLDFFTNRHLCALYKSLSARIVFVERSISIKSRGDLFFNEETAKILQKYRHLIYGEMSNKDRNFANSVKEIKEKYFIKSKEHHHQLVNKLQFLKDLKTIGNNLSKFSREEMVSYLQFARKGVLPLVIGLLSEVEVGNCLEIIESIINKFNLKMMSKVLNYLENRGDPAHETKTMEKRLLSLKKCALCKRALGSENFSPLCNSCYEDKLKNFPERFFPQKTAFENFCKKFDKALQSYDESLGYMIIEFEIPFKSPMTVMDLEATGDINKDRTHFITTMGSLFGSRVEIFQLIDFKKNKAFKKACVKRARKLPRPAVAYNYMGSERIWLNIHEGGWIDIQKARVDVAEDFSEKLISLKLDKISFEWDDITGKDCVAICEEYLETGELTCLKRIAYHNFVDLLREYMIGLMDLKVYDYVEGKVWDPLLNELVERHECPKCKRDFTSSGKLQLHLKNYHDNKNKKKRSTRNKNRT